MNEVLKVNANIANTAWTHVHSHFALMGGFALDLRGLPIDNFQSSDGKKHTRVVPTTAGLL